MFLRKKEPGLITIVVGFLKYEEIFLNTEFFLKFLKTCGCASALESWDGTENGSSGKFLTNEMFFNCDFLSKN